MRSPEGHVRPILPHGRSGHDGTRRVVLAAGALGLVLLASPQRVLAQAAGARLRIGTIGAGRLGGTVGGLWVKSGHPVMFSSRDPREGQELVAKLGPPATTGSVAEAIDFGDGVFL